jgi:hypothetical protein
MLTSSILVNFTCLLSEEKMRYRYISINPQSRQETENLLVPLIYWTKFIIILLINLACENTGFLSNNYIEVFMLFRHRFARPKRKFAVEHHGDPSKLSTRPTYGWRCDAKSLKQCTIKKRSGFLCRWEVQRGWGGFYARSTTSTREKSQNHSR